MNLKTLYRAARAIKARARPLLGRPRACLACRTIGRKHMRRPRLPLWNPDRWRMWECAKCQSMLNRRGEPFAGALCPRCGEQTFRPIAHRLDYIGWNRWLGVEEHCERCGYRTSETVVA